MTKKDLYKTLRIKKTASNSDIKSAYRSRAGETHPDKGGNTKEFSEVSLAYKILSDAKRRLIYDTTGSYQENTENLINVKAMELLTQSFLDLINSNDNILTIDIFRVIHQNLSAYKQQNNTTILKQQARLSLLEKVRAKIKFSKAKETDFLFTALEEQIKCCNLNILLGEENIQIIELAIELSKSYYFTPDAATMQPNINILGDIFTSFRF